MFCRIFPKVIFLYTIFNIATASYGWDGRRDGFVLGGGIGIGPTIYNQTVRDLYTGATLTTGTTTSFGFQTDFKIGYAPMKYLQIHWLSKVSWFGMINVYGDKVLITNGIAGAGVTYFFFKDAPSPFLTGGLGYSTWDDWFGFGMSIGGGYEFLPHCSVNGDILWGIPGTAESGLEASTNALTLRVTINLCGY